MAAAPRLFAAAPGGEAAEAASAESAALTGGRGSSRGRGRGRGRERRARRDHDHDAGSCATCRCSRTCWRRWVDRYVSTLRLQALAFSTCLFVLQVYTAIVFFNMEVLNTLYLSLVSWPIFAPMVTLGLHILVLTLNMAKTANRAAVRKLANITLVGLTLAVYAVFVYSTQRLIDTGRMVRSVGQTSSQNITMRGAENINDITAALFQSCCVNRGWAALNLVPCADIAAGQACPYAAYEEHCVCILDPKEFEYYRTRMTSTYCTGISFNQRLSQKHALILLGPPQEDVQGCGSSEATSFLSGAPNRFQQVFSRYYSVLLTNTLSVNMTFVVVWIATQALGYGIKLIRYMQKRREQVSKNRRRKEIMRKRITIKELYRAGLIGTTRSGGPPFEASSPGVRSALAHAAP